MGIKMITSQLTGGLGGIGNQLFQYSAGRSLALQHGVSLRLLHRINKSLDYTQHKVDLTHFNIQADIVNRIKPIEHILPSSFKSFLQGGFPKVFYETKLHYDEDFARLGSNTRIKGYWQSERYFKSFEKQIREELKIITPPSDRNVKLMEKILILPSVSVHIRRGDYITNPTTNAYHGTCDLNYYDRAMKYIREHMAEDPIIFVFSDDPKWVRENFNPPFQTTYVDFNDVSTSYEDLRLMACCKHNIIANSSFSWWGAWLNQNQNKIVVAPKEWYAKAAAYNPDMVPNDWWSC
jgi:hypothetical protein